MTMPDPSGDRPKRMSTSVKLALMGVGALAVLYSCAPVVGGIPHFWWFGNPFYRSGGWFGSPAGSAPTTTTGSSNPGAAMSPGTTTSQRGGFGSTGSGES